MFRSGQETTYGIMQVERCRQMERGGKNIWLLIFVTRLMSVVLLLYCLLAMEGWAGRVLFVGCKAGPTGWQTREKQKRIC